MFRRQNSTNKQKISKDSKTIETWWNMPIEFSSNQLNDVCSLFQCPPYKVVPPKRYKLVYKPHEYYRYITNKNHNEIGVINLPTEHYRLGAPPCNIHPWPMAPWPRSWKICPRLHPSSVPRGTSASCQCGSWPSKRWSAWTIWTLDRCCPAVS